MKKILRPLDPYSINWRQYWEQNPHLHRGVGADAVEGEGDSDGGDADDQLAVAEWASGIEDESLRASLGKFESQEQALSAIGYKAPEVDWKDDLPEDLKKTADRFTSKEDAIRAIVNLRKRDSQVRVPGKDASEEEVSAYYKAIGVPETPQEYDWSDMGEGSDEQNASREAWSQRLHDLKVPAATAKELVKFLNEDAKAIEAAQIEADKAFAQQQEDSLKSEWKGDAYDKNKNLANQALSKIAENAGVDLESLTQLEMKDGRFLLDRAEMTKLFAVIGKEMQEGTLGPNMTDGERETVDEQIRDIRSKISKAQESGDSKLANKLYQQEQSLLAKLSGNQPVVGAMGRVA